MYLGVRGRKLSDMAAIAYLILSASGYYYYLYAKRCDNRQSAQTLRLSKEVPDKRPKRCPQCRKSEAMCGPSEGRYTEVPLRKEGRHLSELEQQAMRGGTSDCI